MFTMVNAQSYSWHRLVPFLLTASPAPHIMFHLMNIPHIASIPIPVHTYVLRVLIEASGNEFFEGPGVVPCEFGWVVLWDEEEDAHWMEVGVGRLTLGQLNRRNTQ